MSDWFEVALLVFSGLSALLGYCLSALDYEQKVDEGRRITRRVFDRDTRGAPRL